MDVEPWKGQQATVLSVSVLFLLLLVPIMNLLQLCNGISKVLFECGALQSSLNFFFFPVQPLIEVLV